jgi:hypothetical protein
VYYVGTKGFDVTGTDDDLIPCRNPQLRCNDLNRAIFGFLESTSSSIGILEGTYRIHPFQFTVMTLLLNGSLLASGGIGVVLDMELTDTQQAIFILSGNGYRISLNQVK